MTANFSLSLGGSDSTDTPSIHYTGISFFTSRTLAITRPPSSSTVREAVIVVSVLKLFQIDLATIAS